MVWLLNRHLGRGLIPERSWRKIRISLKAPLSLLRGLSWKPLYKVKRSRTVNESGILASVDMAQKALGLTCAPAAARTCAAAGRKQRDAYQSLTVRGRPLRGGRNDLSLFACLCVCAIEWNRQSRARTNNRGDRWPLEEPTSSTSSSS